MPPTFDLLFLTPRGADSKPVAHVLLTADIPHSYPDLQAGQRLVTTPATSAAELNYQITRLHEDLERIQGLARKKFEAMGQPS